jgi:hypothetical protein
MIDPYAGWWDLGLATDEVVVFTSQDHGPYLGEGLEYRVYGSTTLGGATGAQAVITDVYLDGWRPFSATEDANGNLWSSDDVAAKLKLDGSYRYVKVAAWSSVPDLNEPEIDNVARVMPDNPPPVPEFPSVALPMGMIIGIVGLVYVIKGREQ